MAFDLHDWFLLPSLIFLARIGDVSIGTVRLILLARGARVLAPVLGFFEVIIWLMAIGFIMKNLHNVFCYVGYAGGFATGNYIGMLIESRLRLGVVLVRVITNRDSTPLVDHLKSLDVGLTAVEGQGRFGPVKVIFSIVRRVRLEEILAAIKRFNPNAAYSVEDVRSAGEGLFPPRATGSPLSLFHRVRKGK